MLVDRPDVLEQGLVGLSPVARVGGTGSISTLALDPSEAAAAERRRVPVGFAPAAPPSGVTVELRNLGECLWTARDTITVENDGRGGFRLELP